MRRRLPLTLAALSVIALLPALGRAASSADAFGYALSVAAGAPAYAPESLPSAATLPLADDQVSAAVPLGFEFEFYGGRYSRVSVSSNGFLTFNSRSSYGCCDGQPLPTAGGPNNLIAGFWEDLSPNAGQIRYQTLGAAPARRFVVSFDDVALCCVGDDTASFQIKLFEGTDAVEIHYASTPACSTCTAGIENTLGTVGLGWTPSGEANQVYSLAPPAGVTCGAEPAPLGFGAPSYIDTARAGGEPVSIVAQDGAILVSSHAGTTHLFRSLDAPGGAADFAAGYFNQTLNWRSADGGATWKYVGTAGLPAGPHTATSTGFSDPDYAMDSAGRIYNVEIDLANVSVYSSLDDGQSFAIGNAASGSGDRPWVTGQDPDEVFLYINLPRQLWRSTTGGVTWTPILSDIQATGKLHNDPLNPSKGLIGPSFDDGIAISPNEGQSWLRHGGAGLGAQTEFFGAVAVDRAGWVYRAAAGGYASASDVTPNGEVTFDYFDRATKRWGGTVQIPTPPGDALWPWVVAGDDGRVAVVWYQNHAGSPTDFYIYAAYSTNAHGSTVVCSDGVSRFIPPRFSVANASGRAIHNGRICLAGTNCNIVFDPVSADRRLGDFFTVNFDMDGTIFIVSGDTRLPNPLGGPKPVSNPIFIKQTAGAPLLAAPDTPRPTRCTPLPFCPEAP